LEQRNTASPAGAGHLAGTWTGAGEAARHFDAEVDRHDCRRFVMIKEDVVSIGSEAGILVQEGPDLIQRRPEFLRDAIHRHALAHRCENSYTVAYWIYKVIIRRETASVFHLRSRPNAGHAIECWRFGSLLQLL